MIVRPTDSSIEGLAKIVLLLDVLNGRDLPDWVGRGSLGLVEQDRQILIGLLHDSYFLLQKLIVFFQIFNPVIGPVKIMK